MTTPIFMSPKNAAATIAVSAQSLKMMRIKDRKRLAAGEPMEGPEFLERTSPGGRTAVVYPTKQLEAWANQYWGGSSSFYGATGSSPPVRSARAQPRRKANRPKPRRLNRGNSNAQG